MGTSSIDPKTQGAWVVHHAGKLRQVTAIGEYENIEVAGKLGILLSALSASETSRLKMEQVKALSKAAGISTQLELPALLRKLEERRLIEATPREIEVLGVTTSTVLTHTGQAFDSLSPTPSEKAAVYLSEIASVSPVESSAAAEKIGDSFKLSSKEVRDLLRQSEDIGFVDSEDTGGGKRLYFNGNVFRRDSAGKTGAVLASLTEADGRKVQEMEGTLKTKGCVTASEAERVLGPALFKKLQAIGMYDVSKVSNETEQVLYVTRPAAFGKFGDPFTDDALDLAKALVACLTYGMTRSPYTRGRIRMLSLLLRKLLQGKWVGPAEAIGQDYKVLEMKRVVKIRNSGGSFYMSLLKREIGEIALHVLTVGDASEYSLPNFGAAVTRYDPPEENRVVARKTQTAPSKRATRDMLLALRTGK